MNRLSGEKSPYLLQHARNPVHWLPWGPDAFEKARREDKPLLVSIGYATCHWCHVMERESFEDEGIAAVMNENLVCVKVDREERPDVDKVYMTAVQALTGQGGWPLNVFLTPEGHPFIGGTYFPPSDAHGRPGWPTLVKRIGAAWRDPEGRKELVGRGGELMKGLRRYLSEPPAGGGSPLDAAARKALAAALESFRQSYDAAHGGFSYAPKFPMPVNQHLLFRAWAFAPSDAEARRGRDMALETLRAMARGGIYDHVGGGFSRYSVDPRWHVPHFEKMLYDNAQLAMNYVDAFAMTGEAAFAAVARETLDYLLRDMAHPGGGFYSAEDADSFPSEGADRKVEGAFYVWGKKEIDRLLGPTAAGFFRDAYGVEEGGNVEQDPHGEFADKNVLFRALPDGTLLSRFGVPLEEVQGVLSRSRRALFEARAGRPRPFLDDKILMAWNGLAISAFSRAGGVLAEPRYLDAARRAADFVQEKLAVDGAGGPWRRWRDGEASIPAMADDVAFLAQGLLDLYEATMEPRWLEASRRLADRLLSDFSDGQGSLSMTRAGHDPLLPLRPKDDADNVEPSALSVAALTWLRLARHLDHAPFHAAAETALAAHAGLLVEEPRRYPYLLSALLFAVRPPEQVVVAGDPGDPAAAALWAEVRKRFLPFLTPFPGGAGRAKGMTLVEGKPAAYLCRDFACRVPATDPAALGKALDGESGG